MEDVKIVIKKFDNILDAPYLASIENGEYRKIIVQGSSIPECLKELIKSITIMDLYNKKKR